MTTSIYCATAINGSASGAMDTIKYAAPINDGDICFVVDGSEYFLTYRFDLSSSAAESSPTVIEPDDVGAENGRWILADMKVDDILLYGDILVQDSSTIIFTDIAPASDLACVGLKSTYTAGENLAFGNVCYLKSDGKMWKSDADAEATMPVIAMAAATINADASGYFLEWGWARDDSWNWTVGGKIYAGLTAGAIVQDVSGYTTGDQVQLLGIATHADRICFQPMISYYEVA